MLPRCLETSEVCGKNGLNLLSINSRDPKLSIRLILRRKDFNIQRTAKTFQLLKPIKMEYFPTHHRQHKEGRQRVNTSC